MDPSNSEPASKAAAETTPVPPAVIDAVQIFRGAKEVIIEHQGARYRLRVTRRGKLILQK